MLRRRRQSTNGARAASLLGPPALELERGAARVGSGWTRALAVVGYPREVARGWLEPLLRAAGELDLALHVEPLAPALAADRLRRQRARLESTRRLERERGHLSDPTVAAAAEDADELAARLARGESRLWVPNTRSEGANRLIGTHTPSSGRARKSSTIWSRLFASRETWLFDIRSTPSCCTSFSTRRVRSRRSFRLPRLAAAAAAPTRPAASGRRARSSRPAFPSLARGSRRGG
ncbi:MAG TPA: hypothetical protein VEL10_10740 [Gaiellaceae bacterium]|nr:hypothetical protein [Gaiellaceae bacterium]